MIAMTIQIPDDLAAGLEKVAEAQSKSVAQVAIERLQSLSESTASPRSVMETLRSLPYPSRLAVDEMEAAVAAARIPAG